MKFLPRILLAMSLLYTGVVVAQTGANSKTPVKKKRKLNNAKVQYGIASYYSPKFNGRRTANGEIYNHKKLTAAHNGLPLGTWIRVTNQRNGRSVIVKVNDRLHHNNTRLVDMSGAAAKKLGFTSRGLTKVKLEVLGKKKPAELTAINK